MRNGELSPDSRTAALAALASTTAADPLDVFVVGGGVTGAGAAFDAATRGLRVGVVDTADWASGTSSRSSKLMHGGLRYLEMLDFRLVAEALRERDLLLTHTAPHLVEPVAFVFPFENRFIDRAFIGSGVLLYDTMATRPGRKRALPLHRHLGRRALAAHVPGLAEDAAVGALEYYDAKVDDARFVMTLVRSAATFGAHAANHVRVIDYLHTGQRVSGVRARDMLTGEEFDVHARRTILAGGVWTEEQQDLASAEAGLTVLASKGVHITVAEDRISAAPGTGIISKTEKSVLFIIPWDGYWVIGTTDTPWEQDVDVPVATADDIDYLLDHANAVLREKLGPEDVIGVYAGLRPLLQPVLREGVASTKVSREHTVMEVEPGLAAIAGGKFTTYRVMAEDVVDFVLGDEAGERRTLTESVPLLGAQGVASLRRRQEEIAARYGFDEARVARLIRRYGTLLDSVLDLIDEDPELGLPLPGAERYLGAEARYAAAAEGAVRLGDVLERRMRLGYEVRDRGTAAAEAVARIVAPVLGWDEDGVAREVAAFEAHMRAQLAAEATRDDGTAAAIVAGAARDQGREEWQ
ncbi:glycerol-3-phosphate dehydrogenase [Brevibacterium sanguinis]|uniref:Glycerol-3-phosphate dehydrogenase n=2 Tax=Brevibacterium TaxID=1696 RepID=A0A366IG23_9MICO|nr:MULTISPECIES: glycerol-3-phosphate dehydrogenase/oxidase [Brevibacterium]RBP63145.1 glycerol-3-phosphate dehydrogenase [Brevibacterium sanguinis]RBP69679.1 glycerol-3-phosphate dehydrogenase [Brevibacterium celere]